MSEVTRRTVLAAAAAAAPLAACAGQPASPPPMPPPPAPGQPLTPVADVPVGSGTIVDGVFVTQPTAGVFKGFVAQCTHAGCALNRVIDGVAVCPCHSSSFGLDGEVIRGPAFAPLKPRAVKVLRNEVVAE